MPSDRIAELEAHLSTVTGGSLQEEVDALNELALELGTKDDQRTRTLSQRALALSRGASLPNQPYLKGIAFSLYNLGVLASQSSDFSSSLNLCTESRNILEAQDLPDPRLLILVNKELGWIYLNLGDLAQSFGVLLKALRFSRVSGDKEMEARVLITLSIAYSENGDLEASAQTLRKAIEFLEGSPHPRDYCIAVNNLAMTFKGQKMYDDALTAAAQSAAIARQMNQPSLLATTLDTTSQIYLACQEFDLAETYLNEALSIHRGFGNDIAEITLNLARVKIGQHQPEEAKRILLESMPSVEARSVNRFLFQYHELLAEIFESQGDFRAAIEHIKQFHQIKSMVFNEQTQRQIGSLTVLHQEESARMDARIFSLKNKALQQEVIERRKAVAEMNVLATTDPLTGLMNRRHFMTLAGYALEHGQLNHLPASVLMIDIDHFKQVNDRYGHLTGDRVLAQVCSNIQIGLRSGDLPCRYGGEEFVVLLPNTHLEGAQKVAQRLLKIMAETEIWVEGQSIRVSISVGVAPTEAEDCRLEEVLERADQALYLAKHAGRGSVKVFQKPLQA